MNLYNTKLISSCLKQTPNNVKTPEEADPVIEALVAPTAAIAMAVAGTGHSLILCF